MERNCSRVPFSMKSTISTVYSSSSAWARSSATFRCARFARCSVRARGSAVKLVFCGTPRFAGSTLEALIAAGHNVALVVSQPDRPVGRTQEVLATPVKQAALAAGIEVTQPEKIRNNVEFRARIEAMAPDAIVVVAYG